jgi:DNA polymerase III alpha subunit
MKMRWKILTAFWFTRSKLCRSLQTCADLRGGEADTLRKGVGKKKPEVMKALKKDFIEGAL